MTRPNPATVLIVDDEPAILSALERLLRREFAVLTANSATEGLELLHDQQAQVIIADQRMPGMSGAAFLAQVASEYPDAVRLLLTGYADIEGVIAAINKGQVFRYLLKPWNPDELRGTVREAAERYRLVMQNRQLLAQLGAANAELEQRVAARTADLAAANARLQLLDRLKDELLALTSHDLGSLVTTIHMACQILLDERRAARIDPRRYIRTIAETTDRLRILLRDLSDLTMINTGELRLHMRQVLLSDVAQAAAHGLAVRAEAKAITIDIELAAQEPSVVGDYDRLYQVVSNLLSNAIKFTPDGGRILLGIQAEDEYVALSVRDSGIGIPVALLPQLFANFTNPSRPGTAGERGSGLGLAVVYRLLELHGGAIVAESVEGQGSTFIIRLPVP